MLVAMSADLMVMTMLMTLTCEMRCATSSITSDIAALQGTRLTSELIPLYVWLTLDITTLLLELVDRDRREMRSSVVQRLMMVYLMHAMSAVHNMWLYRLLVDDRLHMLVNVVMHMFALGCWGLGMSTMGRAHFTRVLGQTESGVLVGNCVLDPVVVSVAEFLVLDAFIDVRVLLRQDLPVLDGLNSGVMVILVHFPVYGSVDVLVLSGLDMLMLDGRLHMLVVGKLHVSRLSVLQGLLHEVLTSWTSV